MEEFDVKLTKADIWELLGAMELCESESTCFTDSIFAEELQYHTDWDALKEKLRKILYGV